MRARRALLRAQFTRSSAIDLRGARNATTDGAPKEAVALFEKPVTLLLSVLQDLRKQPIEFLLDHGVTLAGAYFQTRTVEHGDSAAAVVDQADFL